VADATLAADEFESWVRSKRSSPWDPALPPTFTVGRAPKFSPLAGLMKASAAAGTVSAHAITGRRRAQPTAANRIVLENRCRFIVFSP
jgi:hypothetical protein